MKFPVSPKTQLYIHAILCSINFPNCYIKCFENTAYSCHIKWSLFILLIRRRSYSQFHKRKILDWIKSTKTVTSYHINLNVPISLYFVQYINTKNYFFENFLIGESYKTRNTTDIRRKFSTHPGHKQEWNEW